MAKVYYGCDDVPFGWERYFDLCNLLEVRNIEKQPTIETLNRWRVESPRNFAFVVHTVPEFERALSTASDLADPAVTAQMGSAWKASEERAHALAAKAILVRTPMDFFPSAGNRQLMEDFAEKIASESKRCVIWEATGAWEMEKTRDFAEEIGLTFALDPFLAQREEVGFTHGDGCFKLSERAGARRSFDQFDMEQMLDWAQTYDRVFVLLRGGYQFEHARKLKAVLEYEEAF